MDKNTVQWKWQQQIFPFYASFQSPTCTSPSVFWESSVMPHKERSLSGSPCSPAHSHWNCVGSNAKNTPDKMKKRFLFLNSPIWPSTIFLVLLALVISWNPLPLYLLWVWHLNFTITSSETCHISSILLRDKCYQYFTCGKVILSNFAKTKFLCLNTPSS